MKNLKLRRKEKGLSGEALGKKVNVQRAAISKYERGEIQPSQDILISLARVLECTTDYLLGLSDEPTMIVKNKKSDTEELGATLKKLFVDAGKISDDEELTESFKVYAIDLVRAAIAFDKARNNNE